MSIFDQRENKSLNITFATEGNDNIQPAIILDYVEPKIQKRPESSATVGQKASSKIVKRKTY